MPFEPQHEAREDSGIRSRRVVGLSLGFVAFAALLAGGLAIFYRKVTGGETLAMTLADFPAPRLQPNPTEDWTVFHQAQAEALEGYRWVDRAEGTIHVPIAQAMALVVARGVHAYDVVEGTPPFPPPGGAPLDGAPRAVPHPAVAPYGAVR